MQGQLRHAPFERFEGHALEERDRVAVHLAPQRRVEFAEEARSVRVPTPPQVLRQRGEPAVRGHKELADGTGLGHDRCQFGARGHQRLFVVRSEHPRRDCLDDEHALQQATVDERHTEKRPVLILARLAEVLEPWMLHGVSHALRPELLCHQADEALGERHPYAPDAVLPQADGGGEHKIVAIRLEQIDRAHVGAELRLDQPHDTGQRLVGVAGAGDKLADRVGWRESVAVWCHRDLRARLQRT